MNPIYKTGWGQYVDLSKICSILPDEKISNPWKDIGVTIFFQLCEKPVECFVSNAVTVSTADSFSRTMPMENDRWILMRDLRESQISQFMMAWENFVNENRNSSS